MTNLGAYLGLTWGFPEIVGFDVSEAIFACHHRRLFSALRDRIKTVASAERARREVAKNQSLLDVNEDVELLSNAAISSAAGF